MTRAITGSLSPRVMTERDFYQLRIGQKIWWADKQVEVETLNSQHEQMDISFKDEPSLKRFKHICSDLRYEPPQMQEVMERLSALEKSKGD